MLLATGACRVRVTGGIDVGAGGSGTVRAGVGLDDEAVKGAGDLAAALRVDDLRQAGWTVTGPRKEGDGLTWVRASKPFSGVEQAVADLAELSGPDGPFKGLTLRRTSSLLHRTTSLSGTVDLSGGLSGFADADLRSKVGDALPLDADALRRQFGPDADKVLSVQFEALLPGSATSNATTRDGGRLVWRPTLGSRLAVSARSSDLAPWPLVVIGLVLVLAVGGGACWWAASRRRP
ncbi:MAG: hypothetical protein ABR511_15060 [Acidimicrobiales bacterium]